MIFAEDEVYHVYNRSFNHTRVFISDDNYQFFLHKASELKSIVNILAYCLMPDHFHLMIHVPAGSPGLARKTPSDIQSEIIADQGGDGTRQTARSGLTGMQVLSRKIGTLQSSYTQAFNKMYQKNGSLFQPKTKSKLVDEDYLFNCLHYIHQNPLKARLVSRIEDWKYSSFNEYYCNSENICNLTLSRDLIDVPTNSRQFLEQSYSTIVDTDSNIE